MTTELDKMLDKSEQVKELAEYLNCSYKMANEILIEVERYSMLMCDGNENYIE